MGFVEGKLEDEKMFGDSVFPKTLLPPAGCNKAIDLAEMIRSENEYLLDTLQRHGAVLFRGFEVASVEDFERAVETFGWEPMVHIGSTTRVKVSDHVFTANEAPLHQFINFHHEMSLVKRSPSKIFFFCEQPAPEGSETSIVRSDVIAQRMEETLPEVVAKLADVGFVFSMRTVTDAEEGAERVLNKTWKWIFKTDDQIEAQKRCLEMLHCSSIHFNSNGSADVIFGPMNPIKEFGGKRVWFISILGFTDNYEDLKRAYGDGSAFPSETLEIYKEMVEENCVDIKWQKGDVLMIDNFTVQHARRPGLPPRRVLFYMCK